MITDEIKKYELWMRIHYTSKSIFFFFFLCVSYVDTIIG